MEHACQLYLLTNKISDAARLLSDAASHYQKQSPRTARQIRDAYDAITEYRARWFDTLLEATRASFMPEAERAANIIALFPAPEGDPLGDLQAIPKAIGLALFAAEQLDALLYKTGEIREELKTLGIGFEEVDPMTNAGRALRLYAGNREPSPPRR